MIDRHPITGGLRRAVLCVASLSWVALIVPACEVDTGGADVGPGASAVGDPCNGARSYIQYTERLDTSGAPVSALCLPVALYTNEQAQVPCAVVEARSVGAASAASCNACSSPGRQPLNAVRQPLADLMQDENPSAALDCFCEIEQAAVDVQDSSSWPCQYDPSPAPVDSQGNPVDGFCYIGDSGLGDQSLAEACPENERRILRFVGAGVPAAGTTVYTVCLTDAFQPAPADCAED